ncbi:MAG: lycopene cyclase family protein [Ilumatobacteraceae bacterium]
MGRYGETVDVAIVGDGPAGLALAAACCTVGLGVVVHGSGEPWRATYAAWRDDVPMVPDEVFSSVTDVVDVVGARRHRIERSYGVFANEALRAHLLADLPPDTVRMGYVDPAVLDAPTVMDATGVDPAVEPRSWQTAYGVVLPEVPVALDVAPDTVTLMDWRQPSCTDGDVDGDGNGDGVRPPSFCYVVPVHDGWLVEETVLAAAPAVAPAALRARLAARLGPEGPALLGGAIRSEEVRIPMGLPLPVVPRPRPRTRPRTRSRPAGGGPVPFGAAAGFVHPATGYSVAASLRAAPRVAQVIAAGGDVWSAVWPRPHRRARALHDYGLDALLRLDGGDTAAFFDAFFELPDERWAAYLRVDVTPREVAGVMRQVFGRAPWRVRRRLAAGDPRVLRRLVAAS